METELSKYLSRQMQLMHEYTTKAERLVDLHQRLKSGASDSAACQAEIDALSKELNELQDRIQKGRDLPFSKPTEKPS